MSSRQKQEEPRATRGYRLSIVPESPEDLEALKKDLVKHEQIRFKFFISIFLQNVVDYANGKRKNISTLIVKEE